MAKGIVRKTEKAAKKQLRQEGAFKGLSRKERIALSKKTASESRDWIRSQMAEGKKAQAVKKSASDAKKREEARASGQKLAYDKGTPGVYEGKPAEQREMAPGGTPTKRLKGNENVSFDDKKGMYKIVGADGYVRYSKSKPAMYGAKVKVKKAEKGASLKSVPSKAKGLSKLPKGVRNKMGYMQEGGKVKSKSVGVLKSDTNKAGPKMEPGKEPYTENGINYTWDRKNSVWRGDADKGLNNKSRAVKKAKIGGKVKKRTTTVTENTPSRFSKFTDAQKTQIKARGEKLKGEDKKDFDYDVARSKDAKSKTTTTTKRRSGKVKSVSVTEKRKSLNSGKSTDVTTASKKRRGGSTRVKTTSYGAGDDKDSGRVVKQKYNRKGELRKTKVIKKGVQNN